MSDIILLITILAAMVVAISASYRSRYWARRAEAADLSATLASYRAHDSAGEAEETLLATERESGRNGSGQ